MQVCLLGSGPNTKRFWIGENYKFRSTYCLGGVGTQFPHLLCVFPKEGGQESRLHKGIRYMCCFFTFTCSQDIFCSVLKS